MTSIKTKPKRILVLGSSSSGKTTFSIRLANRFGYQHVELDALYWGPNWTEAPDHVFQDRVLKAVADEQWVIDGNYQSRVRQIVWPRVDTIVWLDPGLAVVLKRFFIRTFRRSFRGESLWAGNRETLRNSIFKRNSLLVWILKTHQTKVREYRELCKAPPTGVKVYRLSSNVEINEFFRQLPE